LEWVWTDALAIPGGGSPTATLEDEMLTTDVINTMSDVYTKAQAVVVFDALVLQLHPKDISDVAVAMACGKWGYRVWTYQEIKLANEAFIVTATGSYRFKDVYSYLETLKGADSPRYKGLCTWFGSLVKDEKIGISFGDLAFACRHRKSGQDIDYARAFFPTLGLKWEHGMTREEGMQHMYLNYRHNSNPSRIINFAGVPRLKLYPGWAPSNFYGLEGMVTEGLPWSDRGVEGEWYVQHIAKVTYTFTRHGRFVLDLRISVDTHPPIQCVLAADETPDVPANIIKSITAGTCYILDAREPDHPKINKFARQVIIVEKAVTASYDTNFEAAVHAVAVLTSPMTHTEPKKIFFIRHSNPGVDMDLPNQIQYSLHISNPAKIPTTLSKQPGETNLHVAVRSGDLSAVQALLNSSDEITYDAAGYAPIHIAAARDQGSILSALLTHNQNPPSPALLNIPTKTFNADTPLTLSASLGAISSIQTLLPYLTPELLDYTNNSNNTALMAACNTHEQQAIDLLLSAGADPNARTRPLPTSAETPLLTRLCKRFG
jgi:hypothetical protein